MRVNPGDVKERKIEQNMGQENLGVSPDLMP